MEIDVRISKSMTLTRVQTAIESLALVGLGTDGCSEYEVVNTDLTDWMGCAMIYLEVAHREGKFVSKQELTDYITECIEDS